MAKNVSKKSLQLTATTSTTIVITTISAIVVVFSLMASRALLSQKSYLDRIIGKKEQALKQLQLNREAAASLVTSYTTFVNSPENIIGGISNGDGDRDGDNAKIVLDALPSKYDFPALVTSLEKMLSGGAYKINSISGTDDELNQQNIDNSQPQPVEIPFELNVTGNYNSISDLVRLLERSIRPFEVDKMSFEGSDNELTLIIEGKSYYQPSRTLDIRTEIVR